MSSFQFGGKLRCLFILLCLISFKASALKTDSDLADWIDQGGFYALSEVPIQTSRLQTQARAVVKAGSCSAVILSNTGLVVTNLHCIEDCLNGTWDWTPELDQQKIEKSDRYKVLQIRERRPLRLNCPRHLINQYHIYEYQLSEPEFLWFGEGKHNHDERFVNELSQVELSLLQNSVQDIVLLRYKLHPDYPAPPCAKISAVPTRSGQTLWVLGYPSYNQRPNGKNADRSRLSVSLGEVRESVKEDWVYKSYAQRMDLESQAEFWRRESFIWEQDSLLLTSADVYFGNSGGLMMNEGGAVAVTFTISKASSTEYTGGTSIGYRLADLMHQWEEDLGPGITEEIRNCQ